MATTDEEIAQLKAQQALQTQAIRQILEGRLTGADGAAGTLVALEGGATSVDVAPFWGQPAVTPPPAKPDDWQPTDMRGKLPTRAGAAPYGTRPLSGIVGIDIHYTASAPTTTVEQIASYQTGPGAQEAFPAIAYTLVVDGAGISYLCHDLATRTWHNGAPGANTSRVSVCWIGNTAPIQLQIEGMANCIEWVERQLGRALQIRGHKDAPYATTCPGPTWEAWKPDLIDAIQI